MLPFATHENAVENDLGRGKEKSVKLPWRTSIEKRLADHVPVYLRFVSLTMYHCLTEVIEMTVLERLELYY